MKHPLALVAALCASLVATAHAQTTAAGPEARATHNGSTTMTALKTETAPGSAPAAASATADASIRPFKVHIPDEAIADLRRRLKATRWPDKETVAERTQGPQLANLQSLVRYWGTGYDWRKAEAKLNALPQFVTNIDGVDIHFIHVRSKNPNAMPLIISHGWPGSVFEQIKLIGPLTDPVAHGGNAADAFDVVIPSLPGYGFSGRPTETGWGPERIARAWDVLMKRLGYTRYVAQGGDWGSTIVQAMGRQAPEGLLAIHTNLPSAIPGDVAVALATGAPAPASLSDQERATFEATRTYAMEGNSSYFTMMTTRPQAVNFGMTDSPAGLAAFLLVHPGFAHWKFGDDPQQTPTRDEVLDNFSLYWLTNTAASAARLYWENHGKAITSAAAQQTDQIKIPVAISEFPDEAYAPPESWLRRAYPNLVYFHKADAGGHFAAWEHPEEFAGELRAGFRSVREQAAVHSDR